ncbi:pyridoxamine 5'-phosphate oxidase family protein [Geobacter chapellei]|uniref:Pyridoxamine 5'-phosphate oxidase family protein n=2 Tax=Pelotalea chapellei TaxID=44671 RepID=A0ABS5U692_9BACT|nr:pyridoxamine 5'-phosphate oxidase family protein [Pelotalea chapellei]
MLSEEIQQFIRVVPLAVVATTDDTGIPHLALGTDLKHINGELVFENWFCQTTLQNAARNPWVAVAVLKQDIGTGYQFIGKIVNTVDAAILDGYTPGEEAQGQPQVLTRLVVRVEEVLAFCSGLHNDLPLKLK